MAGMPVASVQPAKAGFAFLVAAGVVLVWSATPTVTTFALDSLSPIEAAAMRTGVAGLIALPIACLFRLRLPAHLRDWWLLFVAGSTAFILFPLMLATGLERTSATHAALIIAIGPVATGMMASALDRRIPARRWWVGVGIAISGEYFLIKGGDGASSSGDVVGDLICIVGMLFVSVSYIAGSRLAGRIGSVSVTFWGVSLAALPALVYLGWSTGIGIPDASAISWRAILFLAIATTIIGYAGWYWSLSVGGVTRIAPMQFMVPVLGVVIAALLLDESLTWAVFACGGAIVSGVVIAAWPDRIAK